MKNWIKEKYSALGLTRYKRIINYIDLLDEKITITSQHDLEVVKELKELINERLKAVKVLYIIDTISYFGIYFSFISFFLRDLFLLSEVAHVLSKAIGFFGTTLFVVILFFSNRLSNLYYQDLNLLTSHLIAIYNKYEKEENDPLFGKLNQYSSFINFFKKKLE